MEIEILPMVLSDLDLIKQDLETCFDSFWKESILRQELQNPNSSYLIAKQGNEIVGFGGIWNSGDQIHITNLVTRIDKRQQGIGEKLLVSLISLARTFLLPSITLEVNSNNKIAIHLYQKYGFEILGIRKKYYYHKEDAFIMTHYFKTNKIK